MHNQVAQQHQRPVALLSHEELVPEVPVSEVGCLVLFTIVNVALPFSLQADVVVGEIDHLDPDQVSNLLQQKRKIALDEDNVRRFEFYREASWLQGAVQIVAGCGVVEIVSRDGNPSSLTEVLQALLEQAEVNGFSTQGVDALLLPLITIGEKVVELN